MSGTHSETSASKLRGDSGYTLAEYLLVSVFMTLNPGGLSGVGFHASTPLAAEHFTVTLHWEMWMHLYTVIFKVLIVELFFGELF